MRRGIFFAWLVACGLVFGGAAAQAEFASIATNGDWRTLQSAGGAVGACAVRTAYGAGIFTVGGSTDRQDVLRLGLMKGSWRIPAGLPVPIVLSFSGGAVMQLAGTGNGTLIRANIPEAEVPDFVRHFTEEKVLTVALPEGRELPWLLGLSGTMPAMAAIVRCMDRTGLRLPAPFRASGADDAGTRAIGDGLTALAGTLRAGADAAGSLFGREGGNAAALPGQPGAAAGARDKPGPGGPSDTRAAQLAEARGGAAPAGTKGGMSSKAFMSPLKADPDATFASVVAPRERHGGSATYWLVLLVVLAGVGGWTYFGLRGAARAMARRR